MSLPLAHLATIGARIKYLREQIGMTQPALAAAVGISQPSMSNIESGHTASPSAIHLMAIAAALNANPNWIVYGEGEQSMPSDADESEMLKAFRELDAGRRAAILAAIKALK